MTTPTAARRGAVLLLLLALGALPAVHAQQAASPSVATEKESYLPGEPVLLLGTNWAPRETVTIVIGTEPPGEVTALEATADEGGSFTLTATAPEAPAAASSASSLATRSSARAGEPTDEAEREAGPLSYTVTATGLSSGASAQARFTAGYVDADAEKMLTQELYWMDRLTYPTRRFRPEWVRGAAAQDARMARGIPRGRRRGPRPHGPAARGIGTDDPAAQTDSSPISSDTGPGDAALSSLSTPGPFVPLGPKPERMTGCSGCFDYTTTSGRINSIAVDPTTTTNGSIVAYAASVGGGVWKTTNCCSAATTWTVVTDDPLVSTTSIDTVTIDPANHNTIYAGTGDLNYGSFSMGSQGILKSTDAGATWTVLGADVFGIAYPVPPGQFPQYQAVGKVRVDPLNSSIVAAGTKTGLYLSYDGGANWTGPCLTNPFPTQRQDITALELTDVGGSTRILAAVGARGFATTVQFDLGANGANGIYSAAMPANGCPAFTSIASNTNGFLFGTAVTGSPYTTGASMNAGSGSPYVNTTTGNQVGRIDLAVAPSNPSVIYAQVQSIAPNNNSGCGNANGCQLGVWASANGGATWSFMAGSAGGSLRQCANSGVGSGTAGSGDYPQNWYDQAVAVDPNNPDRIYVSTFDVWVANRTGTAFYDTTCGYSGVSPKPVHVDQHALAFVPGSSSLLLLGNDGGTHGTTNAHVAADGLARPAWFNMDTGFNTIEFYSGDISGNFATSSSPSAAGGAQDNAPSVASFPGGATGPVQWQITVGGDGFYARIDPVGTGPGLRYWVGNNSGGLSRCAATATNTCLASGSGYASRRGNWTGDQQSFILPFDLFHGGIPGGDDCGPAGATTGCGRLIAGTTRVWETITGATATNTWVVTNNPTTQNMTKGSLGNRSFINQVKYSPKWQSAAIVGTNDANVWIGRNLGTGVQSQAIWTNVTGGNTVLPNRPVLGIALDPSAPAANVQTGYAAVGGFNANTPATPGHVFRVVCTADCATFTWSDKSGNLPDIPVDSVIVNPNFPQQVFAGSDLGLYYTDDVTANPPVWTRFEGLPHVMIWDMQIDRGSTTLSLWTRGRGAYAWTLPLTPLAPLPTIVAAAAASGTYAGTVDLSATLTSGGNPLAGKTIAFALNGNAAGTATTDANGVATLTGAALTGIGAGSYPSGVSATFAGDDVYAPGSGSGALEVAKASSSTEVTCPASVVYDGSAQAPCTAAATGAGGLSQAVTVTYENNVDVGTATASATFDGDDNHTGSSDSKTFAITPADSVTVVTCPASVVYTGAALTPCSALATGAGGLSQALPVAYANNVEAGTASASASYPGDPNHGGSSGGATFVVDRAPSSTVVTCPPSVTYDGSPQTPCSAAVTGAGGLSQSLPVSYASNTDAGAATASATYAGDANHTGSTGSATFQIAVASSSTVVTCPASVTYDGTAQAPCTAAVTGAGGLSESLSVNYVNNVHVGTAMASATFAGDANHAGSSASKTFAITRRPASVTPNAASKVYGDADPALTGALLGFVPGDGVTATYGRAPGETVAGSPYLIAAALAPASALADYDVTYNTAGFTILRAPLTVRADDKTRAFAAPTPPLTGSITGIKRSDPISAIYFTSAVATSPVGSYPIVPVLVDPAGRLGNYTVQTVNGTFTITTAAAAVGFVDLTLAYDGTPRAVAVTTIPPGLSVAVTYNGSPTPPTAPGSYALIATVLGGNYVGSATGTLQVSTTATVRHAPSINGRVQGSVEVLLPESQTLNGGAVITSDLLVPGTPTVHLNGSPTYGGTIDGGGSASPSSYTVTLNGGARLGHVVRRTNAVVLPAVQAPPPPTGTRDVVLTQPGQSPGNFATLRNLTLSGGVGAVSVPAGTYGTFTVNGNSSLVLGVAGATTAAVYNLQGLVVNGGASITIVGPVVINLGSGLATNGTIGSASHPQWLTLNFASGGLTVNGGASVHAAVLAPTGTVMVNGNVNGSVAADRLILNGGAVLVAVP